MLVALQASAAWLLNSKVGRIALAVLAALSALQLARMVGASAGKAQARKEATDADIKNARAVEDTADAARRAAANDRRSGRERMHDDHPRNFIDE
jgi:hypothetical protein